MFARAFTAYVADLLTAQGRHSDYLCDNVSPDTIVPDGTEREDINIGFDYVVRELKSKGVLHHRTPEPAENISYGIDTGKRKDKEQER